MKWIRLELPWSTWHLLREKARREGRSCSSVVEGLIWEERDRWWDDVWQDVQDQLEPGGQ